VKYQRRISKISRTKKIAMANRADRGRQCLKNKEASGKPARNAAAGRALQQRCAVAAQLLRSMRAIP